MSERPRTDAEMRYGPLRRAVMAHPWAFAVVAGVLLITLMRPLTRRVPDAPPVSGQLPAFELVEASGAPLTDRTLAGTVWVAAQVYVDDPEPRQPMGALLDLRVLFDRVDAPVQVVGLTVAPEADTPERLAAYRATYGAAATDVRLATGPPDAVRAVAAAAFPPGPGVPRPPRSDRLVIVDGQGRLRGSYPSTGRGVDEVFHRARHVLRDARAEARAGGR